MSNSLSYLNGIVKQRYKTYPVLKRKFGIVKTVISYGKAIVTLEDEDMLKLQRDYKEQGEEYESNRKTRDLTLLNKTGVPLQIGDAVWVYYWNTLTDGYIAHVCGIEQWQDCHIKMLAIIPPSTALDTDLYTHAKIYPAETWEYKLINRTQIIDVYNGKDYLLGSENQSSSDQEHFMMFLMNGFPAVMSGNLGYYFYYHGTSYANRYAAALKEEVGLINHKMFTNRIILNNINFGVFTGRQYVTLTATPDSGNYLEFYAGSVQDDVDSYYGVPYVKFVNNQTDPPTETEYSLNANWSTIYNDTLPMFTTAAEAASSLTMTIISNGIVHEPHSSTWGEISILVRYSNGADCLIWSRFSNTSGITKALTSTNDEYYYEMCAAVGSTPARSDESPW